MTTASNSSLGSRGGVPMSVFSPQTWNLECLGKAAMFSSTFAASTNWRRVGRW